MRASNHGTVRAVVQALRVAVICTGGGEPEPAIVVAEALQVVLNGPVAIDLTDGRVRRGADNRTALVEALVALYEEGELEPTAAQIAQRAGVAVRSVYGHFGDIETLAAEVSERQYQAHRRLMEAEPISGTLTERVNELVARRAALFEAVAPVRRAGMLHAHRSETIAANLHRLAQHLRAQVAQTFAPELDIVGRARTTDVLEAADLLLAWESWERLRTRQGCTPARARRVLSAALIRLLDPTKE
jgi:TetR/AcrR family transcriptional regulator of autoinduction and epiphytic fitness